MYGICYAHAERANAIKVATMPLKAPAGKCQEPGCEGSALYGVERREQPHPIRSDLLGHLTAGSSTYIPKRYGWRPGSKVETA